MTAPSPALLVQGCAACSIRSLCWHTGRRFLCRMCWMDAFGRMPPGDSCMEPAA
jgi:hypothetical protein